MAIRRKLGGSHVGFILSFAIFVIFVIFLFIIIAPANKRKTQKDFILDKLSDDIVKDVTGELTSVSFKIDESFAVPSPLDNCFMIQDIDNAFGIEDNNILAKKISVPSPGTKNAKVEANNLIVDWSDIDWTTPDPADPSKKLDKRFFKLYLSDFITETPTTCTTPNIVPKDDPLTLTEGYIISINQENYIFVNNLIELSDKYENDYDKLKAHFGIPASLDFWFNFTDVDAVPTIMIAPNKINVPESEEVFVKELSLNYIDEQANINRGVLSVKLW